MESALYRDYATSEQFHSEFRSDLDLNRLPSGRFDTNALVMAAGTFCAKRAKLVKVQRSARPGLTGGPSGQAPAGASGPRSGGTSIRHAFRRCRMPITAAAAHGLRAVPGCLREPPRIQDKRHLWALK
jgi:hypothetical protein